MMSLSRPFATCTAIGIEIRTTAGIGELATSLENHPYEFDADTQQLWFQYAFNKSTGERYETPTPSELYTDLDPENIVRIAVEVYPVDDIYCLDYYTYDTSDTNELIELFRDTMPQQVAQEKEVSVLGYQMFDVPHPLLTPKDIIDLLTDHPEIEGRSVDDAFFLEFEFEGVEYAMNEMGELIPKSNQLYEPQDNNSELFEWLNTAVEQVLPESPNSLRVTGLPEWWGRSVAFVDDDNAYADVATIDMSPSLAGDTTEQQWQAAKSIIGSVSGIEPEEFHKFGKVYFDLMKASAFGLNHADAQGKKEYFEEYYDDASVFSDLTSPSDPYAISEPEDIDGAIFDMHQTSALASTAVELLNTLYESEQITVEESNNIIECWLIPDKVKFKVELERERSFLPGYYCPIRPLMYGTVTEIEVLESAIEDESIHIFEQRQNRIILFRVDEVVELRIGDLEPLFEERIINQ